ncbi:MAG: hypothetical protein IJR49_06345 [Treponema sp.]|nr:hypothetical protein [Treponema sp.]
MAKEGIPDFSPVFSKIWNNIAKISEEGGSLAIAPDRNEKNFLQIILGSESQYGKILQEARDVLGKNEAIAIIERIDTLRIENKNLEKKISNLKRERLAAPLESMNPFTKTKKSIDEEINSKIPKQIQFNKEQIEELKKEAIQELSKGGVRLDPAQLEYFLVSAEGEELLQLMTMAGNMILMQSAIENQMKSEKNNIELAKQYTGIHLVSLDAYVSAHNYAIKNLTEYQKKLEPIIKEANHTIDMAKSLIMRADAREQKGLEANIKISMRLIAVANAYDRLLQRRIENLAASKNKVTFKADLARNDYTTMVNGGNLLSLIQKSSRDYDLVMNFSMPELKAIYEPVMMDAFTEISEKLKKEK